MELKCPECGEKVVHGRPSDVTKQTPPDRAQYRHFYGRTQLCPVVGLDSSGKSSYVPALPVDRKL